MHVGKIRKCMTEKFIHACLKNPKVYVGKIPTWLLKNPKVHVGKIRKYMLEKFQHGLWKILKPKAQNLAMWGQIKV